ncbi:MAG: flagellin [Thermoleophilia bacterium]|nr:flagellin [Thermoleophilia bacterium]
MGLSIYNNVDAMSAHRQVNNTNMAISRSIEKLSSGLRINRAADDAAGLAVSEEMRSNIRGMAIAQRNALDGVSVAQIADAAMSSTGDLLGRARDLAVQATNTTLSASQRGNLNVEYQQVMKELDSVGNTVDFNGVKLFNGSLSQAASAMTLQVGYKGDAAGQIAFTLMTVSTTGLSLNGTAISSAVSAASAIASLDAAIQKNTTERAKVGALQNRLEKVIDRLGIMSENTTAAESRVRDADMAKEMIAFSKFQILQQSGMSMLAQANQAPQSVLSLLR